MKTCIYCGKKLRRERFCLEVHGEVRYGDYGDGVFCGLRCGYRYGRAMANLTEKQNPGYLDRLRANVKKAVDLENEAKKVTVDEAQDVNKQEIK